MSELVVAVDAHRVGPVRRNADGPLDQPAGRPAILAGLGRPPGCGVGRGGPLLLALRRDEGGRGRDPQHDHQDQQPARAIELPFQPKGGCCSSGDERVHVPIEELVAGEQSDDPAGVNGPKGTVQMRACAPWRSTNPSPGQTARRKRDGKRRSHRAPR